MYTTLSGHDVDSLNPTIGQMIAHARDKMRHVLFNDGQMIRLYGAELKYSYWLYQLGGEIYIGYKIKEGWMPMPFADKTIYELSNKAGQVVDRMQKLF